MKLYFITEGRFVQRSNGRTYSIDGGFGDTLWERYLAYFEEIIIVARVIVNDNITVNENNIISKTCISFVKLPYYIGPHEYLKVRYKIKRILVDNLKSGAAYICRVPGTIGTLVSRILFKKNIPYGVEVVGDPWDVFAPGGGISHVLRPYFRYKERKNLRCVVRNANAVLYVTNKKLQERYPGGDGIFQIGVSDVKIDTNNIPSSPKKIQEIPTIFKIISVGSLEQMYKAPDIVINALKILLDIGIPCELTWLGAGKYLDELLLLAKKMNIADKVHFMGNVMSNDVIHYLLNSDIFVLVSRTEGLPRALVEAMAVGLPCIGSRVGGIPELLDQNVIVDKNDVNGLVDKVKYMWNNIEFMNEQANRNFIEAKQYYSNVLNEKRALFFQEIKKISLQ